jgi:heavy metal translocating P-type ATPase
MAAHSHDHHHDHSHDHTHDHAHDHAGHSHSHKPRSQSEATYAECCAHEAQIERYIVLYMAGGALVLTSLIAERLNITDELVTGLPALAGALLLAFPLCAGAWTEIKRHKPSSSSLAALAVLAAIATGEYVSAGLLAFVLLVMGLFVRRTAFGAQRAIAELVELTPDTARLVNPDGSDAEVPLSRITVGQTVRVRPGENLPVDGVITAGRSTINQASLTGEAAPVEAGEGSPVYAGTTNLTSIIELKVTQVGEQTTIGKVTQLIREAESTRSPRQLIIEQVAQFFVPIALSVAFITWLVKAQDPATQDQAALTAATVLVVTCPAALLLASPSAMLAAFAAAARLGILVKQPQHLEAAGNVDTIVFDKTGTITTGRFQVTKLAPAEGADGAELLRAAANGEQHSNHPLAQSILATAKAAKIAVDGSTDQEEVHGRGVRARTSLGEILVGRASWLVEIAPYIKDQVDAVESKIEGMTGVHVMRDGRYLGAVGLEDTIRSNVRTVMSRLRELLIKQIFIFTGDRLSVAKRVGVAVGVDAIEAECLPAEKHEQIKGLVRSGHRVLMVGDGINDGPSLAEADVGVAMGLSGSDIAANSAGVALMNDDLSRIPFLIELSRKARVIIAQNVAMSIIIVIAGLILAATGYLNAPAAALYHFVGEIFVLGNSFRLFRFGEGFVEAEKAEEPTRKRRAASVRGLQPQTA